MPGRLVIAYTSNPSGWDAPASENPYAQTFTTPGVAFGLPSVKLLLGRDVAARNS